MRAAILLVVVTCATSSTERAHQEAWQRQRAEHLATRPPEIQEAINSGQVLIGMTTKDVQFALEGSALCDGGTDITAAGRVERIIVCPYMCGDYCKPTAVITLKDGEVALIQQ